MGAYHRKKAEYVVVGSGPGGASVARELAKAGKEVLLLEKGKDHRKKWYYGSHLGATLYCEKGGFLQTEEGFRIVQGTMTGGSTNLYCACASPPPDWMKKRYRIDLDTYVNETTEELNVAPLPRPLWGLATQRVEEAAAELGQTWIPQPKFMNVSKGEPFDCGAKCMLGCRCGAKWTANEYVDEAVRNNCTLITGAKVEEVLISDGAAAGVVATLGGGTEVLRVEAANVILAAGGVATPVILQRSGISDAGRGMVMDTTAIVYGKCREEGMSEDPPMAVSWFDDENGFMLSTLLDPWLMYSMNLSWKGIARPGRLFGYGKTMGIMIKLKDELSGGISMEGRISKPLTEQDQGRLNQASILCRKILIQAGCRPDSVFMSPPMGTHPSGTVRIGDLLSNDLETSIPNLFVSDASSFPEALDRPTVLTLISLGKRLANHLLKKDKPASKAKPKTKTAVKKKTTPKLRAKPKAKPATKPKIKPAAVPVPKAETKPVAVPEPKAEIKADSEPMVETKPKATPKTKARTKKKRAAKKAAAKPKKAAAKAKKAAGKERTEKKAEGRTEPAPEKKPE